MTQSHRRLLERPRIAHAIAQAAAFPAVLLVAKGGSGKTVAANQYVAAAGRPYRRVALGDEAISLDQFVRLLWKAAGVAPAPARDADVAREAAASLAGFSGIFIVDGLSADPRVAHACVRLLRETHERIQWMFLARSDEQLPLGTLIAHEFAGHPLRDTVLQFSPDETAAYAALLERRISEQDVARIRSLTQGWAFATVLALDELARGQSIEAAEAETLATASRYFGEQYFDRLDVVDRELLLAASAVEIADSRILEDALAVDCDRRLFHLTGVVPLTQVAVGRYRLGHLYRRFLARHLASPPNRDLRERVYRCLAEACILAGDFASAMHVMAEAGSYDEAIALLVSHYQEWNNASWPPTLEPALSRIPASKIANQPYVLIARAGMAEHAHAFETAVMLLERAAAEGDPEVRLRVAIAMTAMCLNNNRPISPNRLARALDAACPEPQMRSRALALLAATYAHLERYDEASDALSLAVRELGPSGVRCDNADVFYWLTRAQFSAGQYDAARATALRLLSGMAHGEPSMLVAQANNLLARVALNTTADAESVLRYNAASIEHARRIENAPQYEAYVCRRYVYAFFSGRPDVIEDDVQNWDPASEVRGRYLPIRRFLAHVAAREFADAAYWAKLLPIDDLTLAEDPYYCLAVLSTISVLANDDRLAGTLAKAQGEADLESSLGQGAAFAHRSTRRHRRIASMTAVLCKTLRFEHPSVADTTRILEAVSEDPVSETVRRIVRELVRCVTSGSPVPNLDVFYRDLDSSIYGLLGILLRALGARACSIGAAPILTATEAEILRQLQAGDSPHEIARRRRCSHNTIRTHIQHIYSKLEAKTKLEALNRARAMGIL